MIFSQGILHNIIQLNNNDRTSPQPRISLITSTSIIFRSDHALIWNKYFLWKFLTNEVTLSSVISKWLSTRPSRESASCERALMACDHVWSARHFSNRLSISNYMDFLITCCRQSHSVDNWCKCFPHIQTETFRGIFFMYVQSWPNVPIFTNDPKQLFIYFNPA